MAASEYAMGEDHPATRTVQPAPRTRLTPLSYEAFGEDQPGINMRVDWRPSRSSEGCDHSD